MRKSSPSPNSVYGRCGVDGIGVLPCVQGSRKITLTKLLNLFMGRHSAVFFSIATLLAGR